MKSILILLFLVVSSYSFGQQLVYTPINSAFGGDPFNYPWLLNSANAQNPFQDPNSQFNGLDDFDSLLNRNFLPPGFEGDQIPQQGTSSNGNLEYEVYESTQGLVINILDIITGEQSQIIIPN